MQLQLNLSALVLGILMCLGLQAQEIHSVGSTCQGHDHDPDITVYTQVEHMPLFLGCSPEEENPEVCSLKKQALFIYSQMRYPAEELSAGIGGSCTVSVVLTPVGEVSQVRIKESTQVASLDREAVRIVESMPAWHPGIHQGKLVYVEMDIPIVFEPKMHKRD
jgi:protein TonB